MAEFAEDRGMSYLEKNLNRSFKLKYQKTSMSDIKLQSNGKSQPIENPLKKSEVMIVPDKNGHRASSGILSINFTRSKPKPSLKDHLRFNLALSADIPVNQPVTSPRPTPSKKPLSPHEIPRSGNV